MSDYQSADEFMASCTHAERCMHITAYINSIVENMRILSGSLQEELTTVQRLTNRYKVSNTDFPDSLDARTAVSSFANDLAMTAQAIWEGRNDATP